MIDAEALSVGILGTGDMGSAVGGALRRAGARVVSDLSRRSAHSRALAARAGIEDLGSLEQVVRQVDLLLSIVPPATAFAFASDVAAAMQATGQRPVFVDCNAISPEHMRSIAALFEPLGAVVLDVGIVGRGPPAEIPTRFYFSGPRSPEFQRLRSTEIRFVDLGAGIGTASALKMTYAALNKGTDALHVLVLLLGERLGVRQALLEEFAQSQADVLQRMRERVPFLASTSARYTGEMHEIAATCALAGVTPAFHEGAAWIYGLLAQTPLLQETRATLDRSRTLEEALAVFVQSIRSGE